MFIELLIYNIIHEGDLKNMDNLYVVLKLDDVATEIRKILEIPEDFIVNDNFK